MMAGMSQASTGILSRFLSSNAQILLVISPISETMVILRVRTWHALSLFRAEDFLQAKTTGFLFCRNSLCSWTGQRKLEDVGAPPRHHDPMHHRNGDMTGLGRGLQEKRAGPICN